MVEWCGWVHAHGQRGAGLAGGEEDPTDPMLSRWVRSRHLPPRREALWRRLGRRVAGRLGGHVTVLESRTTERQARHTSMQARPATESYWVLTSYHVPITKALSLLPFVNFDLASIYTVLEETCTLLSRTNGSHSRVSAWTWTGQTLFGCCAGRAGLRAPPRRWVHLHRTGPERPDTRGRGPSTQPV